MVNISKHSFHEFPTFKENDFRSFRSQEKKHTYEQKLKIRGFMHILHSFNFEIFFFVNINKLKFIPELVIDKSKNCFIKTTLTNDQIMYQEKIE